LQGSSAASVLAPGPSAVSLNAGPGASPLMGAATVTANRPAHAPQQAPVITPADCPDGYLNGLKAGNPIVCLEKDQPAAEAATLGSAALATAALATPGVPTPAAVTSSDAACDSDGVSGARVQGLYVLETGATDRSAALMASLKAVGLWTIVRDRAVRTLPVCGRGSSTGCPCPRQPVAAALLAGTVHL